MEKLRRKPSPLSAAVETILSVGFLSSLPQRSLYNDNNFSYFRIICQHCHIFNNRKSTPLSNAIQWFREFTVYDYHPCLTTGCFFHPIRESGHAHRPSSPWWLLLYFPVLPSPLRASRVTKSCKMWSVVTGVFSIILPVSCSCWVPLCLCLCL